MNHRKRKIIYNSALGIVVAGCLIFVGSRFVHLGKVEWSENAQVRQQIIPVNSRIQGFVSEIYFEEYQRVRKGDTLLVIEDAEYRYQLARANADYANALKGREAMGSASVLTKNNVSVTGSAAEEVRIRLENAEREYNRYKRLYEQEAVTKQQYESVKTEYDALKAGYQRMMHEVQSTELASAESASRVGQTDAVVALAMAEVELARLNLSYTVIVAPCDGVVGRKNVECGQLIQPGQCIVDIVDTEETWVVANMKERQTANVHEGDDVDIEVDAIPDVVFKGRVERLSQATGAMMSLLPQDNSSGNFVKIEQRVPVRIAFTQDNDSIAMSRLKNGLNVEVIIHYQ